METDTIKYFEAQQTVINTYDLPQNIKPCVCALLNKSVMAKAKGGDLGRRTAGLIIATDLRNNAISEEQIKKRLDIWNRQNDPPMPQKDIRGILKSTYVLKPNGTYKWNYSCNGKYYETLQFEEVCLGKETCYYFRDNYNKKGYKQQINYTATGWQYVLTPREQYILFHVIPLLEKLKKVYPGYLLFTNYRELNSYTGIQERYFKDILKTLMTYGLIDYKPGTQRLWEHKGTEIRRIIPPPKIPREFINKPKEFKKAIKKQRGENGQDTTNNIP